VTKVVRSKNSGPFEITLDVVFDNARAYQAAKQAGILSRARIAALYGISPPEVLVAEFFDPALAFKATIARRVSSGSRFETDTYGGQQAAPLLDVVVPIPEQP